MFGYGGYATQKFLRLYREQLWNKKRRARTFVAIVFSFNARNMISFNLFLLKKKINLFRRNKNHVAMLIRKFPNLDLEAVKEQFPDVDVERVKASKKARGHIVPV